MNSGMFYRRGSSLTNTLSLPRNVVDLGVDRATDQALTDAAAFPDLNSAIHQKLDAIVTMIEEHKAMSRIESVQLKDEVNKLGSEVMNLERKLETTPSQARVSRIPRDLSVSFQCFTDGYFSCVVTLQEAVKALHDKSAESDKFEGAERYMYNALF